MNIENKT